jgi:hypothetical protein
VPLRKDQATRPGGRGLLYWIASSPRNVVVRIVLYLAVFVAITFVWRHYGLLTPSSFIPELALTQLDPIQKSELDAYQAMNGLITTLTTGLLAGMGYILTSGKKISRSRGTRWLALGSAAFAALSLFLGYFVYEVVIGMLDDQFFNLNMPLLLYPSFAHFFTFLFAVVLFGEFAFHAFFTGVGDEHKPETFDR